MVTTTIWLTPLILLPGVALLVLSTSVRYAQIHEEFHHLLHTSSEANKRIARHLLTRSICFRNALVSLYLGVGFFSIASLVGGITSLIAENVDLVVIGLTFAGIACLVFAAFQLIRESSTSLKIIREHHQQIQMPETAVSQNPAPKL
ncbi:MAG: DUF2721 domain-containing protein [Chloroflexi bacterium]|nr:MAG: DUF2721 domain-containing protein [Chloroflexota bacterium]